LNMIHLKSQFDIEKLAEAGKILAHVLEELMEKVKPGVAGQELEEEAQRLIAERRCRPAFLNYAPKNHPPFPAALCISVNAAVVHGLPSREPFREGDVVGLDLGLVYENKYFVDAARTVIAGEGAVEVKQLIAVTKASLEEGVQAAQPGNTIGDIGAAVQRYVEDQGYEVVRELVGHGVGFGVHEEPQVPNFGQAGTGPRLEPGLVIAIEPMVTKGNPAVKTGADGWAVEVKTGEIAAHWEHTVAVTDSGPIILTQL
jgi:methionyl aminopeptidase